METIKIVTTLFFTDVKDEPNGDDAVTCHVLMPKQATD